MIGLRKKEMKERKSTPEGLLLLLLLLRVVIIIIVLGIITFFFIFKIYSLFFWSSVLTLSAARPYFPSYCDYDEWYDNFHQRRAAAPSNTNK